MARQYAYRKNMNMFAVRMYLPSVAPEEDIEPKNITQAQYELQKKALHYYLVQSQRL